MITLHSRDVFTILCLSVWVSVSAGRLFDDPKKSDAIRIVVFGTIVILINLFVERILW